MLTLPWPEKIPHFDRAVTFSYFYFSLLILLTVYFCKKLLFRHCNNLGEDHDWRSNILFTKFKIMKTQTSVRLWNEWHQFQHLSHVTKMTVNAYGCIHGCRCPKSLWPIIIIINLTRPIYYTNTVDVVQSAITFTVWWRQCCYFSQVLRQ